MLLFPVGVLFVLLFSIGISYVLATEYVFFADIKYLYSIMLRLLMFMSAVFYPVTSLSEKMQVVVKWNPIYLMIYFERECVMYGNVPETYVWIRLSIWCVASLILGMIVFKAKENKIMQTL